MLHEAVVEWLTKTVPGAINNQSRKGKTQYMIKGRIPDVVVKNQGEVIELYEVETHQKASLPKRSRLRRILVIALTDGDWDEIQVVADKENRVFRQLSFDLSEIRELERKIRVQRNRLRGYSKSQNKRIGRHLAEAREKKRVHESW